MNVLTDQLPIEQHLNLIKDVLKAALPNRVSIDVHAGRFNEEDFLTYSKKAPSLLISLLKAQNKSAKLLTISGQLTTQSEPRYQIDMELTIGITILVSNLPKIPRHVLAVRLVNFLLKCLPYNAFTNEQAQGVQVDSIDARNLHSVKLEKQGVMIWGLAFKQILRMQSEAPTFVVPDNILFAESPEIGLAHKDNYKSLTETFGGE